MKEEKEVLQENKPKKLRPKMAFTILILAALFVAELYLMTNYPKNYLLLGLIGLAILCSVYLVTDLVFKLQDENDFWGKSDLENIYKAEKVTYVTMKKSFLEIERTLDRIRELSEIPTEELIQAQKAVGRVTIQRNKENAIAVMDSNDKLSRHILGLNDKLDGILQAAQEPKYDDDLRNSQKETVSRIEALESSQADLKNELTKLTGILTEQTASVMEKLAELSGAMGQQMTLTLPEEAVVTDKAMVADESFIEDEPDVADKTITTEEPMVADESADDDESVSADEAIISEEPVVTDKAADDDESASGNEAMIPEEPIVTDKAVIADNTMTSEESIIADEEPVVADKAIISEEPVIADKPTDHESVSTDEDQISVEPAIADEPTNDESVSTDENVISAESAMADKPADHDESASANEATTPSEQTSNADEPLSEINAALEGMPEVSQKDEPLELKKTMTPQEIAALLEERNEPEPEKAPEPDLSDPGHVMTPEEIAALLANM